MKSRYILSAAALALTALAAHAQTQAPGLWEHTMNMKSAGGEMEKAQAEMQKQLAAMPPEQRKQMEQAMAGRGMTMGAQGTTVKVCVTKEQAARAAEPRMNGDCTRQDVQRSGNTMKFKFECSKPQPSSGEGEMTFVSDKAYTGKTTVTTQVKGQPQQMNMEMSGKWLGADCGDIKPRPMPDK
jgi:uncharacterized membrane protein YkoI